jgi:hypothetical protein
VTADFIWRMEHILDLYAEPYDPKRPKLCFTRCPINCLPISVSPCRLSRVSHAARTMSMNAKGRVMCFWPLSPSLNLSPFVGDQSGRNT